MPGPLRTLALTLAFGAAAQHLIVGHLPGLNVTIATALLLGVTWALRPQGRPLRRREAWLPFGALALAAVPAVRSEAPLVALALAGLIVLALSSVAWLGGGAPGDARAGALVAMLGSTARGIVVRSGSLLAAALTRIAPVIGGKARRSGGHAAGVALALPFLVVFVTLFGSADAVFARAVTETLDPRRWLRELGELPGRALVAATATWLAAGAVAATLRPPRDPGATERAGRLPHDTATGALVAIDALFALFVGVQVAYLFGGQDTIGAAGLTYAAYARRGFFELMAVGTLVGIVLFGSELLVTRRTRAYLAAAFGLIGLTAIVLASAAYRLDLYQRAYGWSELRLYAATAIAVLGVALAILAVAIARGRMAQVLQPLGVTVLGACLALGALGPGETVVRANVARILAPEGLPIDAERRLDVAYLMTLGDGAVAALGELLPSLPPAERADAMGRLRGLAESRRDAAVPWQSWSLDRERARQALAGVRLMLLPAFSLR